MYLNGFNDFGQLKNCLCSKEQATCTCTRITALYVDNINTQQSIHKDLLKSTNIRFIWTNMFFVDGESIHRCLTFTTHLANSTDSKLVIFFLENRI